MEELGLNWIFNVTQQIEVFFFIILNTYRKWKDGTRLQLCNLSNLFQPIVFFSKILQAIFL